MGNSSNSWYKNYLLSDHWIGLRDAKIEDAGFRCERCPRKTQLEVHHKHYETVGCEKLTDLEVLCRPCHQKGHDAEIAAKVIVAPKPPPKCRLESLRDQAASQGGKVGRMEKELASLSTVDAKKYEDAYQRLQWAKNDLQGILRSIRKLSPNKSKGH